MNKNNNLKDLYNELDNNKISNKNKQSNRKVIYITLASVLVLITVVSIVLAILFKPKTKAPEVTKDVNISITQDRQRGALPEDSTLYSYEEWQRKHWKEMWESDYVEPTIDYYNHTKLYAVTSAWPSLGLGYSSLPGDKLDEAGLPNSKYSQLIEEEWQFYVTSYIERLVNSYYGNWHYDQRAMYGDFNNKEFSDIFTDMFTQEFLSSVNIDKPKDWLPIIADWDNNKFGLDGELTSSYSSVFGKVTINKVNDSEEGKLTIEFSVDYQVELNGQDLKDLRSDKIRMELVPNERKTEEDRPVLINKLEKLS